MSEDEFTLTITGGAPAAGPHRDRYVCIGIHCKFGSLPVHILCSKKGIKKGNVRRAEQQMCDPLSINHPFTANIEITLRWFKVQWFTCTTSNVRS